MMPTGMAIEWPTHLKDNFAIAEYVVEHASEEVDSQMVDENYHGCAAILRWIPLADLREGPADINQPNESNEAAYAALPLETMPPILVESGEIQDGQHRFRVARAKGAAGMWAYDVIDEDDLEAELQRLRGGPPRLR